MVKTDQKPLVKTTAHNRVLRKKVHELLTWYAAARWAVVSHPYPVVFPALISGCPGWTMVVPVIDYRFEKQAEYKEGIERKVVKSFGFYASKLFIILYGARGQGV